MAPHPVPPKTAKPVAQPVAQPVVQAQAADPGEISQRGIGIIALIFISIIVIGLFAAFAPPLLALVGCIGTVIAAVVIGSIIGTCKSTYLDKSSGVTASDLEWRAHNHPYSFGYSITRRRRYRRLFPYSGF
jgi:hypothetical protein